MRRLYASLWEIAKMMVYGSAVIILIIPGFFVMLFYLLWIDLNRGSSRSHGHRSTRGETGGIEGMVRRALGRDTVSSTKPLDPHAERRLREISEAAQPGSRTKTEWMRQQEIRQQQKERKERERQEAWDSLVKQGDEAFERKDYEEAIKYYKKTSEINRPSGLTERLREKIAEAEVALLRERGIHIRFTYAGGEVDITKPEEQVRQKYIKKLVEDYGYGIEDIKIEVSIQIGSDKRRCDIAIYDEGKIVGIVEAKSWDTKINKEHRGQLESYMSATPTCKWGVLTNGNEEKCGHRNFQTGEIHWKKEVPKGPNPISEHDMKTLVEAAERYKRWAGAGQQIKENTSLIIEAAREGSVQTIQELLKNGTNVDTRDKDGNTILMNAAWRGHLEVIQVLLKAGSDIEATGEYGETALTFASGTGETEAIETLLKAGANIEAKGRQDGTALMWAANAGHLGSIQALLKAGANIEAQNVNANTALMFAAQEGHSEAVKILLEAGAYIEAENSSRETALMRAAGERHVEATQILLEAGAEREKKKQSEYSRESLMYAAEIGHAEAIQGLLKAGADVNAKDSSGGAGVGVIENKNGYQIGVVEDYGGTTALMGAAQEGQTETIRELLKAGADIEARDNKGGTALMRAAGYGETEAIRVLLKAGADIEARDNNGRTVLMKLAVYGDGEDDEPIMELLDEGADTEARDKWGQTAFDLWQSRPPLIYSSDEIAELLRPEQLSDSNKSLLRAAGKGDIEAIRELLKAGADIEARPKYGGTALMVAAQEGQTKAIREFLELRVKIETKDNNGWTALIYAAKNGQAEAIRELLEAQQDVNPTEPESMMALIGASDNNGYTALMWAVFKGHTEAIRELLKAGADIWSPAEIFTTPAKQYRIYGNRSL